MPKQVDHQERRERIADAVCRLAARQGLDEVTIRRVAAEAGVSMGQVQHYFTTKNQMLLFAFHTMSARVERRMGTAADIQGEPLSTRALLRALLVAMVPTDAAASRHPSGSPSSPEPSSSRASPAPCATARMR